MLVDPAARQPAEAILQNLLLSHRLGRPAGLSPRRSSDTRLSRAGRGRRSTGPAAGVIGGPGFATAPRRGGAAARAGPGARRLGARLLPDLWRSAGLRRAGGAVRGAARLRCGRCATAWAWEYAKGRGLLKKHGLATLDTSTALETPHWRLFGCGACSGYLKVTDHVRAERACHLMLADLLSGDSISWRWLLGLSRGKTPTVWQHTAGQDLDDD